MASLSSLKSKATSAASKIKSTASGAASKVKSTATSARTTASSTASKIKSTVSSASSKVTSAASSVKSTASKAASTVKSTASKVKSTVSSAKTTASSAASKLKSTVSSAKTTASSAASKLKSTASNIKSTASSATSKLKSTASNLKSTATSASSKLKNATSKVTSLGTTVKNTASSTLNNLKSKTGSLGTTVKNSVSNGTSTLKNLANKITSNASNKTSSLTNAFKTLTNKATNNNVLSSISSAIKESKTGGIGALTNLVNKYAGKGTTSLSNTFSTIKNNITSKTTSIKNGLLTSLNSVFSNNSKINISNAINNLKNSLSGKSTSSALSGLFNQAKNLKTNIGSISPLNVFSGLTDKITSAKTNLQNALSNVTSMDTMGVLGLSTTLSGASERIQNSFETWKGKISSLVNGGSMTGIITESINQAESKMNELFDNFHGYAKEVANRLFGISETTVELDAAAAGYYAPEAEEGSNVLGARDYGDLEAGVLGATEDLGMMSSSSGYDDGPGVLGATADLSQPDKTIVDLAKEVMDGKYGVGQARRNALGDDYEAVQAEINNYYKTGKWSDNNAAASSPTYESKTASKPTTSSTNYKALNNKQEVRDWVDNNLTYEEKYSGDNIEKACARYARLRAEKYAEENYGAQGFITEYWKKEKGTGNLVKSTSYRTYFNDKEGYNVSKEPQVGAFMTFGDSNHSAFVEDVKYDSNGNVSSIVISESNYGVSSGNGTYNVRELDANKLASINPTYITYAG